MLQRPAVALAVREQPFYSSATCQVCTVPLRPIVSGTLDDARTRGRQYNGQHTGSVRWLRSCPFRLSGGEQSVGSPGLPLPIRQMRRATDGRWPSRKRGQVPRRFHRLYVGQERRFLRGPRRVPRRVIVPTALAHAFAGGSLWGVVVLTEDKIRRAGRRGLRMPVLSNEHRCSTMSKG